jgi:L-histidine N-alpha-methyltransferase
LVTAAISASGALVPQWGPPNDQPWYDPHAAAACASRRLCHQLPTSCRFLYDDRGSQLYEQITRLPEYYPYRAEKELLEKHADAIASQLPGAGGVVVELGCGDGSKSALLLAALLRRHGRRGVRFCGVDCSAEALRQLQRNLRQLLPELPEEQVTLPASPACPPI